MVFRVATAYLSSKPFSGAGLLPGPLSRDLQQHGQPFRATGLADRPTIGEIARGGISSDCSRVATPSGRNVV